MRKAEPKCCRRLRLTLHLPRAGRIRLKIARVATARYSQGTKPSVVQIRSDNLSPAAIGEPLIAALQQMTPELAAGALAA